MPPKREETKPMTEHNTSNKILDYITVDQITKCMKEADTDLHFEPSMTLGDLIKCTQKGNEKENIEILDGTQIIHQFVIDGDKFEVALDANTGELYEGPKNGKWDSCGNAFFEQNIVKTNKCDKYKSFFEKTKVQYYYKANKNGYWDLKEGPFKITDGDIHSVRDFLCNMMRNKIYKPIIDPDLQFNVIEEGGKKYSYFRFDGTDNNRGFGYNCHDNRPFSKKQEDMKEILRKINIPLYYSEKMNMIYTKSELEKAYGKMENKFAINWEGMKYVHIFRVKIFILGGSTDALLNFNDFREKYMRPIYDNIWDGNVIMGDNMKGNMAVVFRDLLWFENE
jgi:hypothetical protein